jgi:hypothetical protein
MAKRRKPAVAPMPEGMREYFRQFGAAGGVIGGKKRWAGVSADERKRQMRDVVRARWAKKTKRST